MDQLDPELYQYLSHIADNLKANRATVLVGAGFSRNADGGSPSSPGFPTWFQLADAFWEKLRPNQGSETRYLSPLTLAEQVEVTYGRPELDALLISKIPDAQYRPSALHKKLLTLPWTDVFTTNYDTLLERACQEITDKRFNIVYCQEDLVGSGDAPRIIKLHGTFPSHRPFIITLEDYRCYPRDFAPFINTVQQSLLENTLCLLGFSGDDQNFNQWLGWIHDNLGPDNSPQVYLFTHEDYSEAQKKLLYRKKVVVLNIASFDPAGSPRQRYEKLLDWLLEKVHSAKPVWPGLLDLRKGEKEKSLLEASRELRDIREVYPGWLVPPDNERKRVNLLRRSAKGLLIGLGTQEQEGELTFLYEYNWLLEKCLYPLTSHEAELFQKVIERRPIANSDSNDEEKGYVLALYLALLRYYREEGNREGWQTVFKTMDRGRQYMSEEQTHRLAYECCLFAMICFDYKELQRFLEEWEVDEGVPEWSLRKAGLLAESGSLAQACDLLQDALTFVRRQLSTDAQNYCLLSQESALMTLKRYVEQAIQFEKESWGEGKNQFNPDAERSSIHRKYELDWYAEDTSFQLQLKSLSQVQKSNSNRASFDFGRRTVSFSYGEDTDVLTSFAFLRFREETGHPFRIVNVTSGNKAAIGAAVRISPYYFHKAVVTIARAYDEKSVEDIVTRPVLSEMTAPEVDALCRIYLDALRRTESELDAKDWFSPRNFAGFTAGILPKLISHLCCKCTLLVLDEILQTLLKMYNSDCRLNYKNVRELTERLINAFTKEQQQERVPILLKFPLLGDETSKIYGFPDPFAFISLDNQKPPGDIETVPDSDKLFDKAQSSSNGEGAAALRRLVVLFHMGLLAVEQESRLGQLLWDVGLPVLEGYYRTSCLYLPHPEAIDPRELVREALMSDLQARLEKKKTSFSYRDILLDELYAAAQEGLFTLKEMPFLLRFSLFEQKRLIHYLNREFLDTDDTVRRQLYYLSMVLAYLLLYTENWEIGKEEQEVMEEMLRIFQENRLSNPALEILWRRKWDKVMSERKLVSSALLQGSNYEKLAAYQTVMLPYHNKSEKMHYCLLNKEDLEYLFNLIAQQVLWRNYQCLVSAIHVMVDVLRYFPDTISLEMEEALLVGLKCLLEESRITGRDSVEDAGEKGDIRRAAARLAWEMLSRYKTGESKVEELEMLVVLHRWREVCMNQDEFVEIRKTWMERKKECIY